MFDPWTADVDAVVLAHTAAAKNAYPSEPMAWTLVGWERSPLAQWGAAQGILEDRKRIEDGGGRQVISAVAACLRHGLVAPEWLAEVFAERLRAVESADAVSWDDPRVFGRPHGRAHQDALRSEADYAGAIYRAVVLAHEEDGRAIDGDLFEEIGAHFGFKKTKTQRLYLSIASAVRTAADSAAELAYREACRRLHDAVFPAPDSL